MTDQELLGTLAKVLRTAGGRKWLVTLAQEEAARLEEEAIKTSAHWVRTLLNGNVTGAAGLEEHVQALEEHVQALIVMRANILNVALPTVYEPDFPSAELDAIKDALKVQASSPSESLVEGKQGKRKGDRVCPKQV